jgi:spermidine/putrescine transport system permease protein
MRDHARRGGRLLRLNMALVFAFLYTPLVVLVVLSFNRSRFASAWGGFSTQWYGVLFRDGPVLRAVATTLSIAIMATLLSIAFGLPLALGLERYRRSAALDGAVYFPLLIPDIVTGIGLLSFFATIKFPLGQRSIIIAHSVWGIAFATAIIRTRLRGFDRSIEEASLDLGVKELPTFFKITLPVIWPGVVAAALVVFTLSVDEFVIAYFTAGTTVTFPIQIYSMIRFGITPEINAVATILLSVTMLSIVTATLVMGRRGSRTRMVEAES